VVELPAVVCIPPPLRTLIDRSGPVGRLAGRPWAPGVPGLPGNNPARGTVPGTTLLHGGTVGTGPVQPPPAQARSPLAGPLPAGLDLVHLLRTRISTLRRVPIAASFTCVRALTCLLHPLERIKTWENLARLLLFPRIALAAPARDGKATRSSSTQQCRLNCLAAVMDPLGGTDHPQKPAGGDRRPPDTRPEQGRGTGDGCCLAPSLGPDSSGRPGPPSGRGAGTGPPTSDVRWGM